MVNKRESTHVPLFLSLLFFMVTHTVKNVTSPTLNTCSLLSLELSERESAGLVSLLFKSQFFYGSVYGSAISSSLFLKIKFFKLLKNSHLKLNKFYFIILSHPREVLRCNWMKNLFALRLINPFLILFRITYWNIIRNKNFNFNINIFHLMLCCFTALGMYS